MITTQSQEPYFDDFDKTKNYFRVLFRPGYSAQVRELNQLQSALQNQIDTFGSAILKNGARVLGDAPKFDNRVSYVKIKENSAVDYLEKDSDGNYVFVGKTLRGTANGAEDTDVGNVTATILNITPPTYDDSGLETDPLTFFVQYLKSGGITNADDEGVVAAFRADETLVTDDEDEIEVVVESTETDSLGNTIYPTGFGSRAYVPEAIYFVNGCFVHAPAESIITSKYVINPFVRVIYKINENIITSADDVSLLDNSLNTPNAGAPGAHRYQIDLELALDNYRESDARVSEYINVLIIENGLVKTKDISEYSDLDNTIAKRTYEESGNYWLKPFDLKIKELYKDTTSLDSDYHDGLYTEDQLNNIYYEEISSGESAIDYGQDRLGLYVGRRGSTAYVQGRRIEFNDEHLVTLEKARTYNAETSIATYSRVGNYIVIDYGAIPTAGPDLLPSIKYENINLHKADTTLIGTAYVRNIEYHDANQLKVYLANISLTSDTFADVDYIETSGGFSASLNTSELFEAGFNSYVFKLPSNVTREVENVEYYIRAENTQTIPLSNTYTWVLTGNDSFISSNVNDYPTLESDSHGLIYPTTVSLSLDQKTATLLYAQTLNGSTTVISNVRRSTSGGPGKSKTRKTGSYIVTSSNKTVGQSDQLNRVDIISITGVYTSGSDSATPNSSDTNITSSYVLDNGQRDSYYDYGSIRLLNDKPIPTGQILVEYEYYEHTGSGDYFATNSYIDLDTAIDAAEYDLIPTYNGVELRDSLDFRPTIIEINAGTGVTLSRYPNITLDLEYFLPRYDKVYLTQNGKVGIKYGVPSLNPTIPADIPETMTLYTLKVDAYTFSKSNVTLNRHEHRRYTMRDIGELDNRLTILENKYELHQLELEALSQQLLDDNGDDEFKNGTVVDPILGHIVGSTDSLDYAVSFDIDNNIIYPHFYQNNVKLLFNAASGESVNYRQTGPLVTLNYYQIPQIKQEFASYSERINTSELIYWQGDLTLSPGIDEWYDTTTLPDIHHDDPHGVYDGMAHEELPELMWCSLWERWVNKTTHVKAKTKGVRRGEIIYYTSNGGRDVSRALAEHEHHYHNPHDHSLDATPYIRSRMIHFTASGLKPYTRHWLFIDDFNASAYARQSNVALTNYYADDSDQQTYKGYTSHPDGSTKLIADANGDIHGSFIIPNNDEHKIEAGDINVELLDTSNGVENISFTNSIYSANTFDRSNVDRNINNTLEATEAAVINPPLNGAEETIRNGLGLDNDIVQYVALDEGLGWPIIISDLYNRAIITPTAGIGIYNHHNHVRLGISNPFNNTLINSTFVNDVGNAKV